MGLIIIIINRMIDVLSLLVFIYILLGYFLSPYHPVRKTMGQFIEPLLNPLRKVVPPISGLDFSPIILILLFRVVGWVLTSILRGFI